MRISDWSSDVCASDRSITDLGMAPPGHAAFYALAPVAHLGKAQADWDGAFGDRFADSILEEVARRPSPPCPPAPGRKSVVAGKGLAIRLVVGVTRMIN